MYRMRYISIDCRVEITSMCPSLHQCNAETQLCCALLPRAGRASPTKTKNMLRIVAVDDAQAVFSCPAA